MRLATLPPRGEGVLLGERDAERGDIDRLGERERASERGVCDLVRERPREELRDGEREAIGRRGVRSARVNDSRSLMRLDK